MSTYILRPPSVRETPAGFGRLLMRYPIHRGDTLLVTAGAVTRVRTASVQETQAADFCYLGGHEYTISQAEYDMLVAAGYSAYIEVLP